MQETEIKEEALDCLQNQNDSKLIFINEGEAPFTAAKLIHISTLHKFIVSIMILWADGLRLITWALALISTRELVSLTNSKYEI